MKVSVITPFYEGNKYMEDYQDMMLMNMANLSESDEIEVVLVNDSPGTVISLRGAVAANRNWKIVKNPRNSGIHWSRVNGLANATGDYILFLDQDDKLASDAIASFLERARHLAEVGKAVNEGVKSQKAQAEETGLQMDGAQEAMCYQVIVANAVLEQKDWEQLWYRTAYHKTLVGDLRTYLRVGTQIISPGQCLIPKALIPQFWIDHIMVKNGSDDYFLWLLMLEEGIPFNYLDKPLYVHHFTEQNLSADTTVTDESSYEFIEILRGQEDNMRPADLFTLERMLHFKQDFRRADRSGKIRLALHHPSLMWSNIVFKWRTKTGYGFNRG